jgi:crotonobetainyl-CoA:carnitine CoA-transferase CaiB-like acyl-CoA transferase
LPGLGKQVFLRLVEQADLVLENFRPGVMDRLGLSYEALTLANPRIVYCAISGFGGDGPWAGRPAYDQIVQGLSGAMSITGDAASAPMRTGFPLADTLGGMTAAFAISAALVRQRSTGVGERIDVSMVESMLAAMGWVVSNYLNAGVVPTPLGNDNFTAAPSGAFAANEQRQFEALCRVVGREALATDRRFATRMARKENRAALTACLEEALSVRTAADWERELNAAGVPSSVIATVPEALTNPQVVGRDFVEAVDLQGADVRVTRPGFRMAGGYAPATSPPELGADTAAWMRRLGFDATEIAAVLKQGQGGQG